MRKEIKINDRNWELSSSMDLNRPCADFLYFSLIEKRFQDRIERATRPDLVIAQ